MSNFNFTTQVIVGGAGWSGISLANILHDAGLDFCILEASDRVGGRMRNDMFGNIGNKKYSIELGAQWVNGLEFNPTWDLAQKVKLDGALDSFNFTFYDRNGQRDEKEERFLRKSECAAVKSAHRTAIRLATDCLQLNEGVALGRKRQKFCDKIEEKFVPKNDDDITLEHAYLAGAGFSVQDRPSPSNARTCQIWYNDFTKGLEPVDVSTNNSFPSGPAAGFGEGDYLVADPRGYAWLPKHQASTFLKTSMKTEEEVSFDDPRLRLNHKVTSVKWDPQGMDDVVVEVCLTEPLVQPSLPVLYACKEGPENRLRIQSKEFVSTFAPSVIQKTIELELAEFDVSQSHDIAPRFDPPLSASIDGMIESTMAFTLGLYTKVFFQFQEHFWGSEEYILSAMSSNQWIGDFAPVWINLAQSNWYPGSNILVLYATGARARELATLTDDQAMNELLPILSSMFKKDLHASDVLDFHMTRWTKDPLFYGGFETTPFGVSWEDRKRLGQRYGNLIFSGSASCYFYAGWTHGAYLSGVRTAQFLLRDRYGFDDLDVTNTCDDGNDCKSYPNKRSCKAVAGGKKCKWDKNVTKCLEKK